MKKDRIAVAIQSAEDRKKAKRPWIFSLSLRRRAIYFALVIYLKKLFIYTGFRFFYPQKGYTKRNLPAKGGCCGHSMNSS